MSLGHFELTVQNSRNVNREHTCPLLSSRQARDTIGFIPSTDDVERRNNEGHQGTQSKQIVKKQENMKIVRLYFYRN